MAGIHATSGSSGQELMRPNGRRGMQADTLSTYFELVDETWSRAKAGAQTCFERHYSIAGLTVRLQFAGPALLPLITAGLAHLKLGAASGGACTDGTAMGLRVDQCRDAAGADPS